MPLGAPEGTSEPRTPTLHQLPLGGSDLSAILVHVVRKLSVARNRNPLIQVHMVRPHLRPVTLFCLRDPLHQRPTFSRSSCVGLDKRRTPPSLVALPSGQVGVH